MQCLYSLQAALRGIPSEIIVVDNNSTDGSLDYAEPMFPDVQFVRLSENLGFGRANNLGFDMALEHGARFVLCLNPDTLISEDTMTTMLQYMAEHPDVGLSGCKLLNADGTFQLSCRRGFPTPWASFTKVFGLQALFPKSRWFAQYNQTFRSENETYDIDAVAGAFMFIRRETLERIHGFDEDFFMYGEDLDLCYRVIVAGWKVAYIHSTSIIHYKGESTRRSDINEVRVFYEAMVIFTRKHFSSSPLFLLFLRAGIFVREGIAYLSHYRREASLLLADALAINASLLIATKLWKSIWFAFPDYAYPTVFIAVSLVTLGSVLAVGEYSPYQKPSIRRVFSGLMISFFILSTLPYFFKSYAFSRAVLVMTITFSVVFTAMIRIGLTLLEKVVHSQSERRVALLGINRATERLIERLQAPQGLGGFNAEIGLQEAYSTIIVGIISTEQTSMNQSSANQSSVNQLSDGTLQSLQSLRDVPVIGNVSYLRKLIEQHRIHEIIITDTVMPRAEVIRIMMDAAELPAQARATFRFAREYDDVIAERVLERYTGDTPAITQYNLALWKYRFVKRLSDFVGTLFLLTVGLPVVYLVSQDFVHAVKAFFDVLRGKKSLIGLYPLKENTQQLGSIGLEGLTGLAHVHSPERLSTQAIQNINEFYIQHYSLWLDVEILTTLMFKKRRP